MATVKNAHLRYRVLNSCFANPQKRYWTLDELVEQLGHFDIIVSRRTVERDIETMRHDTRLFHEAPIIFDRVEKAFCYERRDFTIDNLPLSTDDVRILRLAAGILQQYRATASMQQFAGVFDKITRLVDHIRMPQNNDVILFEKAPFSKGEEFFDRLAEAIAEECVLLVTYRKFDRATNDEHLFHPYYLREYKGRWYVLGFSEARATTITFALDRIVAITTREKLFDRSHKPDPQQYFSHTIGVTLTSEPPQQVILWFSDAVAPYIQTQHLHHTQTTISENDAGITISLTLTPNPELLQLILSYGPEVRVIAPAGLKQQVALSLQRTLQRYERGAPEQNEILCPDN